MKRLSTFSLMLILVLSLFSCEEPVVPVSNIILNSETLTLTEGEEFKLTATASPSNATDKSVVWSSSDATIASVNNGVVTAIRVGAVTITATSLSGGARATCLVTVKSRFVDVQSISLNVSQVDMGIGDSMSLRATVKPDNATNKAVTWSSSDASVANVTNNGTVTALKAGTANIIAKVGAIQATCVVTVIVPISSITLDKSSVTITEGQSLFLNATVWPADATYKTVTWSSSNTAAATVNNGLVTALAKGSAIITANAGGKSATCTVIVEPSLEPITPGDGHSW